MIGSPRLHPSHWLLSPTSGGYVPQPVVYPRGESLQMVPHFSQIKLLITTGSSVTRKSGPVSSQFFGADSGFVISIWFVMSSISGGSMRRPVTLVVIFTVGLVDSLAECLGHQFFLLS